MKIITTVGTSLIGNSGVDCSALENLDFSEELFDVNNNSNIKKAIQNKEQLLLKFIENNSENACAELASLKKIDPENIAEVYLICTETIHSYMCGRVLTQYIGKSAKLKIIKGLQVKILEDFKKRGVPNLLSEMETIAQNGYYWNDVILNLTGGYKAIIPIMTIIGQIKNLPIYYLFKGEDDKKYELIEIPSMPIDFQTDLFDKFGDWFKKFGLNGNELINVSDLGFEFLESCRGFMEEADNLIMLNPVGKILWWNYQQRFFFFKTTDDIWEEIKNQSDIQRILKTKLYSPTIRANKTEIKQDHFVFDDGNNNNRIYYFEYEDEIYIYRTFENEEKAKAFINIPFGHEQRTDFIKKSKSFSLQIQS